MSDQSRPTPDAEIKRCRHGVILPHECRDCFAESEPDARADTIAALANNLAASDSKNASLRGEVKAVGEEIAELRRLLREATEALEKSIERDSARAEILNEIADLFGIGSEARTPDTILTNIRNAKRRSECLSAIERFHSFVNDDDGTEECPLSWGDSPAGYEAKYKQLMEVQSAIKRDLAERIAELEKEVGVYTLACTRYGADLTTANAENAKLRDVLSELVDLVEDAYTGDYEIDSFTTQPARQALAGKETSQ